MSTSGPFETDNSTRNSTSPLPSDCEFHLYLSPERLGSAVEQHVTKMARGEAKTQFLIVFNLPKAAMGDVDRWRSEIRKSTRVTYYNGRGLGILKLMPSEEHAAVTLL